MSYIGERVAYLNGLMEGLSIGEETPEQKMIKKIVEVLEDIAEVIEELDDAIVEVDDRVMEMDEDLSLVEDLLFDDAEDEYDEDDFLEILCPHCNETIYFDRDAMLEEELICPVCKEDIFPQEEDDE